MKETNRQINVVCHVPGVVHNDKNDRHLVLQVVLKNGEEYVLNLSGAQYGHTEAVLPWSQFLETKAKEVLKRSPSGRARIKAGHQCHDEGPLGYVTRAHAYATRAMEQSIDQWEGDNISLHAMLKLPEERFKQRQEDFLVALQKALKQVTIKCKTGKGLVGHADGSELTARQACKVFSSFEKIHIC